MTSSGALMNSVRPVSVSARMRNYLELTKPRISVMVLFTVAAAGYAASSMPGWNAWGILHAVIGTCLIAASGSALNQYLERYFDARMKRTSLRPLPARRLTSMEVVLFGTVTFGCGVVYLFQAAGLVPGLIGLATWVIYVWIYTPLKRITWFNTVVGAVAGASPILIGWSATAPLSDPLVWSMFGVLLLWQFPHFMAIAWLYRQDYADGHMKMLPVVDPTGRHAGIEAALCAAVLIPVALVPVWTVPACPTWFPVVVLIAMLGYFACSVAFMLRRDDGTARRLLRYSLLLLPFYFGLLMLAI